MHRLFFIILLIAACAEPVDTDANGSTGVIDPDGEVTRVVHVSDGDSLIVEIDGVEQRVRLIGINAPEADECFGPEARDHLGELVLNHTVTLVEDVDPADQYGRLLRYVYREGTLVNLELVAGGYAMARSYEPNTFHQSDFDEAQALARDRNVGMWSTATCSVASSLAIISIRADADGPDDENLNDEWIEIANTGDQSLALGDWSVRDGESVNRYRFPSGFMLDGASTVRISTGCGDDRPDRLYWCAAQPIWNNSGDVAYLLDPNGKIASRLEY